MSNHKPKRKSGSSIFPESLMESTFEEELQQQLQPEKSIPDKIWYVNQGLPIFKTIDLIFLKEKPSTKNIQSFIFHEEGNITQQNIDISTGEKYSTVSTGEWIIERGLFKIKYEGSIYVDTMNRNEKNEFEKKTILKRAYKGYSEYTILDFNEERFVLRRKGDAVYKEKIMEERK